VRRIELLAGVALPSFDQGAMQRLIDGAVKEDADLDFEEPLYGASDSAKRDLAGDVAALANAVGGVLVLGVRDEDALAVELTPVALSDAEELRMRQIVAANVAPYPRFIIHRVLSADEPSRGWYLVEVPRSPWAPHAVRVGDALRYPRRDGSGNRWLSESEVADAYRSRFESTRAQVARLDEVRRQGDEALPSNEDACWLTTTLVPDLPGQLSLSKSLVAEAGELPRALGIPRLTQSALMHYATRTRVGHRRVIVHIGEDQHGAPMGGLLHLHTDGSAFAALEIGGRPRPEWVGGERPSEVHVDDEMLVQEVVGLIATLVGHATPCGVEGIAAIELALTSDLPMSLVHGRGEFRQGGSWNERPLLVAPTSRRTVDLSAVATGPVALLAATSLCLADLFQGFGVIEPPQVTADGAIRVRYWSNRAQVERESARLNFNLTEETL
jgi:hypothetical protein